MTWTPKTSPADVRTVGVIGTGVIGGGWAAKFLAQGYDVVAWDPGPDAAERLARLHDIAWPSLERLGLADGASRDRLRVVATLEEVAEQADVIQESGPEVLDLKVDLLGRLDAAADPGVAILSSTSGFRMTDMAGAAASASWIGNCFAHEPRCRVSPVRIARPDWPPNSPSVKVLRLPR